MTGIKQKTFSNCGPRFIICIKTIVSKISSHGFIALDKPSVHSRVFLLPRDPCNELNM